MCFKGAAEAYEPSIGVVLDFGGSTLPIGLKNWPILSLNEAGLEVADLSLLPSPISTALLEAALGPLLEGLSRVCSTVVGLSQLELSGLPPTPGERLEFVIVHQATGLPWADGCIFISDTLLETVANLWAQVPKGKQESFPALPFQLRVEAGRQTLTYEEFQSLRLNDIIFTNEALSPEKGSFIVSLSGRPMFMAEASGPSITLKKAMSSDTPSLVGQSTVLDDLPIDIQFSLGEKQVPLETLRSLKAGYTFELDQAPNGPVSLYVANRMVAQGELVDVGGKLGVRLTAIGQATSVTQGTGNVFQSDEDR